MQRRETVNVLKFFLASGACPEVFHASLRKETQVLERVLKSRYCHILSQSGWAGNVSDFLIVDSVQFSAESLHHLQPARIPKHTLRHSDLREDHHFEKPLGQTLPHPHP